MTHHIQATCKMLVDNGLGEFSIMCYIEKFVVQNEECEAVLCTTDTRRLFGFTVEDFFCTFVFKNEEQKSKFILKYL